MIWEGRAELCSVGVATKVSPRKLGKKNLLGGWVEVQVVLVELAEITPGYSTE